MTSALLALWLTLAGAATLPPESIVPKQQAAAAGYYEQCGDALASWGAFAAAAANYRKSLERQPDRYEAQVDLARTLAHMHQGMQALQQVQVVLRAQPKHQEGNRVYGQLLLAAGKPGEAEKVFLGVVRQYPDDAEAFRLLGASLAAQKRLGDAEVELRRAVRLNPRDAEAYGLLGQVMIGLKKPEAAIAALSKLVEMRPDHLPALGMLAELYVSSRRYADALAVGKLLLAQQPDNPRFLGAMAQVLLQLGRPDDAAVYFRKTLAKTPDPGVIGRVSGWLAQYHWGKGQFGEAAGYLRRLVRLQPNLVEPRQRLVLSYELTHDWRSAAAAMRSLTALHPDNLMFRFKLFDLYLRAGYDRMARTAAREITRRWGSDPRVSVQVAGGLWRQGHTRDAVTVLEASLRRFPREKGVAYPLTDLYQRLGRPDKAHGLMETFYRLDPKDPLPRHALAADAFDQHQYPKVVELLEPMLKGKTLRPDALPLLAWAYEQTERYVAAGQLYQQMAALYREPLLLLSAGRQAEKLGEWPLAARLYEQVLKRYPKHVPTLIEYGRALGSLGSFAKATGVFEQAVVLQPTNPLALRSYAHALRADGRTDRAREAYAKLARLDPANDYARAVEGDLARERDGLEAAMAIWREGLRTAPGSSALRLRLAEGHRSQGQYEQALAEYDQAARRSSSDWLTRLIAADATGDLGRFDDARRLWDLASQSLAGGSAWVNRRWLDTFAREGEPALGLESALQRLAAAPDDAALAGPLLDYAATHGELRRLTNGLNELLATRRHAVALRDAYGRSLRAEGRAEEALGWYAEQARANPLEALWPLRRGELLEDRGDAAGAAAAYELAARVAPAASGERLAPALAGLVRAHVRAGSLDAAQAAWQRLLAAAPDDERWLAAALRPLAAAGGGEAARDAVNATLNRSAGGRRRHPALLGVLGLAQELNGQTAAAEASYREALAGAPHLVLPADGLKRLSGGARWLSRPPGERRESNRLAPTPH